MLQPAHRDFHRAADRLARHADAASTGCARSAAWKARPRRPTSRSDAARLRGARRRRRSAPRSCWPRWSAPASWRSGWRAATARSRCSCNTHADRRDPGRADPDVRPAVGRAFQSGGDAGVLHGAASCRGATPRVYIAVQIAGGIAGVLAAHVMFDLPLWQVSQTVRTGARPMVRRSGRDVRAAADDLRLPARRAAPRSPYAVGLYITAAYWFTASTSFANPAVTIARSLSDTFAGIAPASVPAFIAAQLAGALLAVLAANTAFPNSCSVMHRGRRPGRPLFGASFATRTAWRPPRSKPKSAGASRWPGRCRCGSSWRCASPIRSTATT